MDLPGHGARQDERFTLEGALATIDAAVRSCDRPPLLVGLSLGGYASLAYAGRHGDSVAGVMLSGCSAEIKGKPVGLFRRVASRVTDWLHVGGEGWHVVTDMLAALAGYSPLADLRRLTMPVQLVNGRFDPFRLDEWRYRRAMPGARLHERAAGLPPRAAPAEDGTGRGRRLTQRRSAAARDRRRRLTQRRSAAPRRDLHPSTTGAAHPTPVRSSAARVTESEPNLAATASSATCSPVRSGARSRVPCT